MNKKKRIVILALALVLCVGMLIGCNGGNGGNDAASGTTTAGTRTPGTGETLVLPEVTAEEGAETTFDIDAFYEEQYAQMTPEEIAQFEQDLIDLGITKEELASLLFYNENAQTVAAGTSAPADSSVAEDTTAAE